MARIPIVKTLRRSPFEKLMEHAKIVLEGGQELKKMFEAYLKGEFSEFEQSMKKIDELESQADRIKGNIRNHLPSSILMPVDKSLFLMLLSEEDKVMDVMQDVGVWISMREKPPRDDLQKDFEDLLNKVEECMEKYSEVVGRLNELVETSFSGKVREETKKAIRELHQLESESDEIERKITKKLFELEDVLSTGEFYHLMKLVMLLGDIADRLENCGDRIRAMMAR